MPAASKTQRLIAYLLDEIDAGRLRPGDKIPSGEELRAIGGRLADEDKPVSITVVREAVNYLKATGVLEGMSGVGVFVKEKT
jgi:DNA-binding GntR family transcriptional regulator